MQLHNMQNSDKEGNTLEPMICMISDIHIFPLLPFITAHSVTVKREHNLCWDLCAGLGKKKTPPGVSNCIDTWVLYS